MAYFTGNAINILGAQEPHADSLIEQKLSKDALMHILISKNVFIHNYGLNIGFGSVINIDGR